MGGAGITKVVHVVYVHLRMKMTSFPHFFVFLGVLLLILCRERCCGQSDSYLSNATSLLCSIFYVIVFSSGNCPYRYCSHSVTLSCSSGGLVSLPCIVYNATGPIQVRWYHSQNGKPEELNITTGGRYTVEESEQSPSNSRYESCTEGDQLYRNALKFNYSEDDSGSYWCCVVTGDDTTLELSEAWTVQSGSAPATCGTASQTDPKCAVQIAPILTSTTLLVQSTSTSVVRTTSEPSVSVTTVTHSPVQTHSPVKTPSVSSTSAISSPTSGLLGCRLGEVSCFVYLGAGLGVFVVIVALLVVVVIVLVHISVKIRKKKMKGESTVADDSKGVKSFELTEHQQHPTEENSSATTAAEDMYSTPNVSSKGQPQTPVTQDNFYHVLEGPTPPTGTSTYSSPERSTAPGKREEHKYDEPVRPNWCINMSGHQLGGELFDDPSYQSTFAPVISTQPHTQTELPNSARADLLPSPSTTSSVEDKTVTSDPSYQLSSPSRLPTASRPTVQFNSESKKGTRDDTHAFSRNLKNAQEDDYDQPAAITIKNKELHSNEGGDQPVLFDDPTYQVASAPV